MQEGILARSFRCLLCPGMTRHERVASASSTLDFRVAKQASPVSAQTRVTPARTADASASHGGYTVRCVRCEMRSASLRIVYCCTQGVQVELTGFSSVNPRPPGRGWRRGYPPISEKRHRAGIEVLLFIAEFATQRGNDLGNGLHRLAADQPIPFCFQALTSRSILR